MSGPTKKAGGCTKQNESKAPAVASPTKNKAGATSTDKRVAKEAVKLPSITPPALPQAKKTSKTETSSLTSKSLTPTSPMRPNIKSKSGGKTSLAPVTTTPTEQLILATTSDVVEHLVEPASVAPTEEADSAESTDSIQPREPDRSEAEAPEEAVKAAAIAREEEALRHRKESGNGMIKLTYEQYDELFPIVDGSTTQAHIDDVYCLSFVMPNCLVHLSYHPNSERFARENNGIFDSLVPEDPRGTYHDLVKDQTYYVVVEQEADQLRRDQEATKAKWEPAMKQAKFEKDDGRGFETCSCIYGNPCVDEYGCKDWHSRFAVATANGWKGF